MKIFNMVNHPVDLSIARSVKRAAKQVDSLVSAGITTLEKDTVSFSPEAERATQIVVAHSTNALEEKLEKELGDKMLKKLAFYIERLPENAKMNHPVQISENGNSFSFLIEKQVNGQTKVSIQQKREGQFPWEDSIRFITDKNGNMISGRSGEIVFERGRNNTRRIVANTRAYMASSDGKTWNGVKGTHALTFMPSYILDDSYLQRLFLRLASSNSSVFRNLGLK